MKAGRLFPLLLPLGLLACPSPKPMPNVDPLPRLGASDGGSDAAVASAPQPRRLLLREAYRGVRGAIDGHDFGTAATLFAALKTPDNAVDACAHQYLGARILLLSGNVKAAAEQWEVLAKAPAESSCKLAPYAALRAASARLALRDGAQAEADAALCPSDFAASAEAKLVIADALVLQNKRREAASTYRAWYKDHRSGARFPQVALWLVKEGREGAEADGFTPAEAYATLTRIVIEAPASPEATEAERLRVAMASTLSPPVKPTLTLAERAKRAQALASADRRVEALAEVEAILREKTEKNVPTEGKCQAALLRPTLMHGDKNRIADAWGDAISACSTEEELATALYNGGKASYSAGRHEEALQRFADTERKAPNHRFADDARFRSAFVHRDRGDDTKFVEALTTLPDTYPNGDMKAEAMFRLALRSMAAGDDAAAIPFLDRARTLSEATPATDHHWATAGRAAYFRARIAEKTDRADAIKRYTEVIERYPLAYYMLQASAQLSLLDPKEAEAVRARAEARDDAAPRDLKAERVLGSPAFERAAALLTVEEPEAAKREFVSAGAFGDNAEPASTWLAAAEYDAAQIWETSHAYTRSKLSDYLEHYPRGAWRSAWEIAYPAAFAPVVREAASTYRVPASLVWGIMREESSFIAPVKSHAGAIGLMQLMPETAKATARGTSLPWDEKSLKQPHVSIPIGTKHLGQLRASVPHLGFAIAAYNAGPGALRKWGPSVTSAPFDLAVELIPYEETRGYVKRVLSSMAAYAYLHDPASLPDLLSLPRKIDGAAAP
ncbi:MAG: transglycosylase SLT domain-containing protein [Polyangiaceae bacterium]